MLRGICVDVVLCANSPKRSSSDLSVGPRILAARLTSATRTEEVETTPNADGAKALLGATARERRNATWNFMVQDFF